MGSTNLPRSGDDPTSERRKERPVTDLDTATSLITGATDGLGRRIARDLPASGATILLVAQPRREARRDHGARDPREDEQRAAALLPGRPLLTRRGTPAGRRSKGRLRPPGYSDPQRPCVCSRTGYLQGWPRAYLRC